MISLIKTGVNFRKISVEKMRATLKKMVAPKNCVLRILRGDLDSAEGEIAASPPGISDAEPLSVSDFIWRT